MLPPVLYLAPLLVLGYPREQILGISLASRTIDQLQIQRPLAKKERTAKPREVHRVAAKPVSYIGPERHPANAIFPKDGKRIFPRSKRRTHGGSPSVAQLHFPLT